MKCFNTSRIKITTALVVVMLHFEIYPAKHVERVARNLYNSAMTPEVVHTEESTREFWELSFLTHTIEKDFISQASLVCFTLDIPLWKQGF